MARQGFAGALGRGVRRGRLAANQDVERGDQLVAAVDTRQVEAGTALVAGHDRRTDHGLHDLRLLLERALQLLADVEFDGPNGTVHSEHRQQESVESRLNLSQQGAESIAIQHPTKLTNIREIRIVENADHRRVDVKS